MKIELFRLIDIETFQNFAGKTKDQAKSLLNYYEKTGKLVKVKRGVYVNPKEDISKFEISNFCFPNSYISLENILYEAWIIKQYSLGVIQSISNTTKTQEFTFSGVIFRNYQINCKVGNNYDIGINIWDDPIWKATKERALLDLLYLKLFSKNYFFDNELYLDKIDFWQLETLSKLYGKRMEKYIKKNVLGRDILLIK